MIRFKSTIFFYLFIFSLLFSAYPISVFAKSGKAVKKGTFYLAWGYNRDWFSKSDIHFKNSVSNAYDFTIYNVKANDRPGFNQILTSDLSIPQYVFRIGYYADKYNAGIEVNFDHVKYVMVQNQVAHLKGRIGESYYDTDTLLSNDFVKFEHTNGANFLLLNLIKNKKIHSAFNQKLKASGVAKIGGGIVIPKTDVTLFGERLDNKFHVAGYIFAIETGLRFEMFNYFFIEPAVKGSYANYLNVLTVGNGKANHHFWTFETILSAGIQFRL